MDMKRTRRAFIGEVAAVVGAIAVSGRVSHGAAADRSADSTTAGGGFSRRRGSRTGSKVRSSRIPARVFRISASITTASAG